MESIHYILINANILFAIGLLHLYWFFGGRVSIQYFFPAHSSIRKKKSKPYGMVLLIKAIFLFLLAWFFIEQMTTFLKIFTPEMFKWGDRLIAVVFTARAFGNFTYIGFTKSFRKGLFAKLDTFIYSPLCLLIAFFSYMLSLTNFV